MYKYYFILNQHTRPIECPLILFFPAPKVIIFWIVKILKSILSKVVIITCTLTIIRQRNTTSRKVLKISKHNPYKSKHIWIAIITIQDLGVVIFNFWWEGEKIRIIPYLLDVLYIIIKSQISSEGAIQ